MSLNWDMVGVAGCWLLVAGCWLLVAGCWLLVAKALTGFRVEQEKGQRYCPEHACCADSVDLLDLLDLSLHRFTGASGSQSGSVGAIQVQKVQRVHGSPTHARTVATSNPQLTTAVLAPFPSGRWLREDGR